MVYTTVPPEESRGKLFFWKVTAFRMRYARKTVEVDKENHLSARIQRDMSVNRNKLFCSDDEICCMHAEAKEKGGKRWLRMGNLVPLRNQPTTVHAMAAVADTARNFHAVDQW